MDFNNDEFQQHINSLPSGQLPDGSMANMYIKTNAGYFEYGQVFEAVTVKGNKNYIIFAFERTDPKRGDRWAYYFHGDKALKMPASKFQSHIDYGDLNPIPKEKVEPERMSLAVLGLNAMANGVSFNDYLKVCWGYGEGSQA